MRREGARTGTIYVYDRGHTKAWNDGHRCVAILDAATQSFGLLTDAAPHFSATLSGDSCSTNTGETQVNGDLTVAYCDHVHVELAVPGSGRSRPPPARPTRDRAASSR